MKSTLIAFSLVLIALSPLHAHADEIVPVASGPAAFYAQNYDAGGWDRIIARHISWGQGDATTFPYSADGFYCVNPDYVFGNILTVQANGREATCTIADAVAPADEGHWRASVVIEMSYALFIYLDLPDNNQVVVLADVTQH